MPNLNDFARDPQKAMRDLEEKLGAKPGELLREMEALGDGTDDWTQHLPFSIARAYYTDPRVRAEYETHVDRCSLCSTLLEILQPSPEESAAFAKVAIRARSRQSLTRKMATVATALVIALLGFAAWALWAPRVAPSPPQPEVAQPKARDDVRPAETLAVSGVAEADRSAAKAVEPVRVASAPRKSPPDDTHSAQSWVADVKLSSSSEERHEVSPQPTFSAGEPVQLTTQLQDAPTQTPVTVVWYGPEGERMSAETSWTHRDQRALSFTAPNSASWKSGDYRAELWIANKKVRQEPFEIKDVRPLR